MNEHEINIRAEEIEEIISSPPHWIIRWGILLMFIIILGGFISVFFIEIGGLSIIEKILIKFEYK